MATKDLSQYDINSVPSAENMRFGVVVAEWNFEVTSALANGAIDTLKKHDATDNNIFVKYVPGTFELPLGGQFFAEHENVDAIILLGCVIQGETRHFDYICEAVAQGTKDLNLKYNKPFIFGVLTTNNQQQAIDRAGGKHGNKGDEAAVTAIKMVEFKKSFLQ
ncbi:MAG: 6,7-dimethyl-8-ribityllumazine synthase [Draconibacterium sp.]|nr:6,7-dimethyl-8-ribityllumazine synthase [Draconibacterium sp.]